MQVYLSRLVVFHLRLEPSQLSLGTAFALFVLDLRSRVGTSYLHFWTGPPGLVSKAVEVVAIPGVIGTIQRFHSAVKVSNF